MGGHFFLSSNVQNPQNNGAVLTIAQIIDAVMSSAAEAELGALFINAKEAVYIRRILKEMGHPNLELQFKLTTQLRKVSSTLECG